MNNSFLISWINNSLSYFQIIYPWILVGIVISIILKKYLSQNIVRKFLGKSDVLSILIAEIIGALSPVSIIALLPLAPTILSDGASPTTLIAFLLSARAYNPEALPISISLLGLKITFFNLLITFLGITICSVILKRGHLRIKSNINKESSFLMQIISFIGYILVGIIIAGLLVSIMSPNIISQYGGQSILSIPFTILFGFLVYLGFVGYFPIAKSFLDLGVSHAAVITFLNSANIINLTFLLMFIPIIGKKNSIRIFTVYFLIVLISGIVLYIAHI